MKIVDIGNKKNEKKKTINEHITAMMEDVEGGGGVGDAILITTAEDGTVSFMYSDYPLTAVGKLELAKTLILGAVE